MLSFLNRIASADLENTIMFELSAQSSHFISVALEHPFNECMATVELRLHASATDAATAASIACTIHTGDRAADARNAERLSRIVQRCCSIPVAMRALIRLWELDRLRGDGGFGGEGGGDVASGDAFQQLQPPQPSPAQQPPKSDGDAASGDGGAGVADGTRASLDAQTVASTNVDELTVKRRRTEEFWGVVGAQNQATNAAC